MGYLFTVTVESVNLTSTHYATEPEAATSRAAVAAVTDADERFALSPVFYEPDSATEVDERF